MDKQVPIIIPSYEPDERLIKLLEALNDAEQGPVIVVNDGSSNEYDEIFERVKEIINKTEGEYIAYEKNYGKGHALKTGFKQVLENYPDAIGAVTADSDGQHSPECIAQIKKTLIDNPDSLVLGARSFSKEDVPWKSYFGNTITIKVFKLASGIHVSDTQTGLRGIPKALLKDSINIKGERFEFEMQMLLECASTGKYPVIEEPIITIYDSKEEHQTHFDPIRDSVKIYRVIGWKFIKFTLASLSSCIVDLFLFSVFCSLFKQAYPTVYIAGATVLARIISAIYNYIINHKVVFKSNEKLSASGFKYFTLAIVQMSLSAVFTTFGSILFYMIPEVIVKAVVDTILFFVSYQIQKRYVF